MANFKEVTSEFATPWTPENPGDILEGTYRGSEEVPNPGNRADAKGKKTFTSYQIETEEGEKMAVTGGMLHRKFAQIPKGTTVRVTYLGKVKVSGGNTAKDFKVECDENTALQDLHADDNIPF